MGNDVIGEAAVEANARPTMKQRQWQLRQDAILDAAAELLDSKGFNGMTLEDITEAIGISRPTLYLHFKSKEDVVAHLVIRSLCSVRDFAASLDPSDSPGTRLRKMTHFMMQMRFNECRAPLYDLTKIKLTHCGGQPELREAELQFSQELADLIQAAQASGEAWSGICPEMMVLILSGFVKNLEIDTLIAEGKTTPAEIEAAALSILFRA